MLSVSDLIDINYIPAESDISLDLLVDFYETYLCKRIFIFTLRDGQVVKLFFRDATELFHVSGIDYVYEGVPMDGTRFIQEIKAGNIDLTTVKNVNAAAYKDYEIRVRSMACIDTIIKNCEYLWYPYNAFEYMSGYVAESFKCGDKEEKFEESRLTPFLFHFTSVSAESSFEVYFTLPDDKAEKTYNYGFASIRKV